MIVFAGFRSRWTTPSAAGSARPSRAAAPAGPAARAAAARGGGSGSRAAGPRGARARGAAAGPSRTASKPRRITGWSRRVEHPASARGRRGCARRRPGAGGRASRRRSRAGGRRRPGRPRSDGRRRAAGARGGRGRSRRPRPGASVARSSLFAVTCRSRILDRRHGQRAGPTPGPARFLELAGQVPPGSGRPVRCRVPCRDAGRRPGRGVVGVRVAGPGALGGPGRGAGVAVAACRPSSPP